ncbi:MAG: glycosyl transferase [Lentisphaeria bacterium]|jgi:hypothetical protein
MKHYCTYFDQHYLAQGLVACESLLRHSSDASIWVLCLDETTYDYLATYALPSILPIRLEDFEAGDAELLAAKANRSRVEYYFTCTPSIILYVLRKNPDATLVTYIDADLFFLSSTEPLFEEFGNHSIGIIEHRFSPGLGSLAANGRFNVGWLTFRADPAGMAGLQWWREKCNEWCYDRVEEERFGDQKYLDRFPALFPRVKVFSHPGANVGPWNVSNSVFTYRKGQVLVDGLPLIFYHCQGLRRIWLNVHDLGFRALNVYPSKIIVRQVLKPYLIQVYESVARTGTGMASLRKRHTKKKTALSSIREFAASVKSLLLGQYIWLRK